MNWLTEKFKPKFFILMLVICALLATIVSWLTKINFYIILAIIVFAVLINGVIATVEDRDREDD